MLCIVYYQINLWKRTKARISSFQLFSFNNKDFPNCMDVSQILIIISILYTNKLESNEAWKYVYKQVHKKYSTAFNWLKSCILNCLQNPIKSDKTIVLKLKYHKMSLYNNYIFGFLNFWQNMRHALCRESSFYLEIRFTFSYQKTFRYFLLVQSFCQAQILSNIIQKFNKLYDSNKFSQKVSA